MVDIIMPRILFTSSQPVNRPIFRPILPFLYSQLSRVCNRFLHAFQLRFFPDQSLTTFPVQTKLSMVACEYPTPGASFLFAMTHFLLSGKQHNRHCVTLGNELTPHPKMVEIILRPEPGVEKKVLDVGQSSSVIPRKASLRVSSFRR